MTNQTTRALSGSGTADAADSGQWLRAFFRRPLGRALAGLAALLLIGALLEPRSVAPAVLLTMLPFAAVLCVASVGQHLVIQQRGFDLSVAGIMSASAVLVTQLAAGGGSGRLGLAVLATLAFGTLAGLVNGLLIRALRITPLVTTIGMNAVMLGLAYGLSNGVPVSAHPVLVGLMNGRLLGVPQIALLALVMLAVAVFVLARTRMGRQFIAVGVNPATARALAFPVARYQVMTYALAGFGFASAAILLSGFLTTPTLLCGVPYMLTTVAAVVVGGNPLNGDKGSLPATLIGALFLTYLNQLVISLGFAQSIQNITQAAIILLGVALPAAFRGTTR
ncbi:ABC transporter permease [Pseudooceanicola sp. CBS1P-1]|uniref:ABC transporter permease n=1 Tax=Pseudooceanicola albus TaxID=2692189 RepID=A0A6L7GAY6_9RHOB|nr:MULTISPECIES: ABC transporter permease [Pseudooceanicola]MBT9384319.1 ABC transporter permease [Pseudooceanicola endophyticus]MXN19943.1 ABC transporter permease [Pseudooceanicola albus]